MIATLSQPLLMTFAAVVIYAVICRARHFDRRTVWYVKAQHAAVAIGALLAVFVPLEWVGACFGGGTAAFLLLSAPRWRDDAPRGITKDA